MSDQWFSSLSSLRCTMKAQVLCLQNQNRGGCVHTLCLHVIGRNWHCNIFLQYIQQNEKIQGFSPDTCNAMFYLCTDTDRGRTSGDRVFESFLKFTNVLMCRGCVIHICNLNRLYLQISHGKWETCELSFCNKQKKSCNMMCLS